MANYLYNGVELPALPEWNKEIYPYAIIKLFSVTTGGSTYDWWRIYLFPVALSGNGDGAILASGIQHQWFNFNPHMGDVEWGELCPTEPDTSEGDITFKPIWTNHDILNEDGSVYLAASDPVPVSTLDPTAFVQGYRVGQMLRGMR